MEEKGKDVLLFEAVEDDNGSFWMVGSKLVKKNGPSEKVVFKVEKIMGELDQLHEQIESTRRRIERSRDLLNSISYRIRH